MTKDVKVLLQSQENKLIPDNSHILGLFMFSLMLAVLSWALPHSSLHYFLSKWGGTQDGKSITFVILQNATKLTHALPSYKEVSKKMLTEHAGITLAFFRGCSCWSALLTSELKSSSLHIKHDRIRQTERTGFSILYGKEKHNRYLNKKFNKTKRWAVIFY